MAGKLIWHVTASIDGFIADPKDELAWAFGYSTPGSRIAEAVIESTGAILAGRRWWEVAREKYDGIDGIYGGAWKGPVLVLTHRIPKRESEPRVSYLSCGMAEAIDEAFEAAEGRNVVVFGASIAQQCIREGRLTDLVMHMVPVLLGNGIRLVEEESIDATRLRLVSSENHGQIIDVHLRIRNGI